MAGRRKGGSPFKTLLEGIVTAFLIGIMLVILAVTPAWDAIVDATGIGHHVDVSSLFRKDPVRPDGSEMILKPGQSGGQTDSTTTQPNRQPDDTTTPVGLRILSSPMCVHFRYGPYILNVRNFSWKFLHCLPYSP